MTLSTWQPRWIPFVCFLAGFGIPVSLALENIAAGLMVFTFLLSPALWKQLSLACRHPFVLACVIFWFLFVLGLTYTPVPMERGLWMLTKLRAYLFSPLLFSLLLLAPARKGLITGFALGTLLSLWLSLGSAITQTPLVLGEIGDWQVFHTHVYHNYYIALFVCGLLALWFSGRLPVRWKIPVALIMLLGAVDIFFLVRGRTIQLIFPLMLGLLIVVWKGRKTLLPVVLLITLLMPALFYFSPAVQSGVAHIRQDLALYHQGHPETSVGLRLSFYKHTLGLIAQKPLWGYGTGSFPSVYQKRVAGDSSLLTGNPHNDFLWMMVEVGILGPILLMGMLITLAWKAWCGSVVQRLNGTVLSVSMGVATLANSFFTDNITGLGFVLLACVVLAGDTIFVSIHPPLSPTPLPQAGEGK